MCTVTPRVDRVVLQRADQLEARAVADVREARIAVAAEVALQDPPVCRAVEHRAPRFQLAHAIGRLLGVNLGHAPVVDVLAAAHRVGEMHLPVVAVVDVGQAPRRCRLPPSPYAPCRAATCRSGRPTRPCRRRLDGGAQTGAAGADHEHVVVESRVAPHLEQPPVGPDAHRAEPDVEVGKCHGAQAAPGPDHVPAIQAADALVARDACRRLRSSSQSPPTRCRSEWQPRV